MSDYCPPAQSPLETKFVEAAYRVLGRPLPGDSRYPAIIGSSADLGFSEDENLRVLDAIARITGVELTDREMAAKHETPNDWERYLLSSGVQRAHFDRCGRVNDVHSDIG